MNFNDFRNEKLKDPEILAAYNSFTSEDLDDEDLDNDEEPFSNVGSFGSVLYEIEYGTIWTVIDEIWHHPWLEWIQPNLHFRFCLWAHRND